MCEMLDEDVKQRARAARQSAALCCLEKRHLTPFGSSEIPARASRVLSG